MIKKTDNKMNNKLNATSQLLLLPLNGAMSMLEMQEPTLENDKSVFQKLHNLYYDIRYAKTSNKASLNPSRKMNEELKIIYAYLMINIKNIHDRHKKRLSYILSKQMEEELEHPQIDTPRKADLKDLFSRTVLFIQYMEILLT